MHYIQINLDNYCDNKKSLSAIGPSVNLLKKKGISPSIYNEVVDLVDKQMFREDDPAVSSQSYREWLESAFHK